MRARVDRECAVTLKLNGSDYLPLRRGLRPDQLPGGVAGVMEREGVDALEISVGHYESGLPVARGTFDHYFTGCWRRGFAATSPPSGRRACTTCDPWRPRRSTCSGRIPRVSTDHARRFKAALCLPIICGWLPDPGGHGAGHRGRAVRPRLCGRAMIADPLLHRHLQERTAGPQCVFCNACVARVGGRPVDCYHPDVRRAKDLMLTGTVASRPAKESRPVLTVVPGPAFERPLQREH